MSEKHSSTPKKSAKRRRYTSSSVGGDVQIVDEMPMPRPASSRAETVFQQSTAKLEVGKRCIALIQGCL
jgi:hypothetical protein